MFFFCFFLTWQGESLVDVCFYCFFDERGWFNMRLCFRIMPVCFSVVNLCAILVLWRVLWGFRTVYMVLWGLCRVVFFWWKLLSWEQNIGVQWGPCRFCVGMFKVYMDCIYLVFFLLLSQISAESKNSLANGPCLGHFFGNALQGALVRVRSIKHRSMIYLSQNIRWF